MPFSTTAFAMTSCVVAAVRAGAVCPESKSLEDFGHYQSSFCVTLVTATFFRVVVVAKPDRVTNNLAGIWQFDLGE